MSTPMLAGAARVVTQDQLHLYAEASGDHNPLHLDEQFAAATMFGRTIAHGMLVLAFISEMMTAAFGERWLRAGALDVRFRAPVFPGDEVQAVGTLREGGGKVYDVVVRNQDGVDVITGTATVGASDG